MSLVAAFVWRKSPLPSICTFVYDNETIEIISKPKIYFLPQNFFSFRKKAKKIINDFISELNQLAKRYKKILFLNIRLYLM